MNYRSCLPVVLVGLVAGYTTGINAAEESNTRFSWSGDIRTGYFSLHRDDRNGSSDVTDEFRLRVRAGVGLALTDAVTAKIRVAGRYSTDKRNDNHFEIFESIPAGDGLRRGDSTIDEMYLQYQPNKQWKIKFGRMQTKFEAEGVAKKSLDRNDSPNTDITWTDGLYVRYTADNGWATHAIMQYNPNQRATEVRREPLDFNQANSHASYFIGWENKKALGPVVQRGLDITYLPDSLQKDDSAADRIVDYWGIVGRVAAQWPVLSGDTKFMLGGELGYAPETPAKAAISTGATGDASGVAGFVTFNLINFLPQHSVGLVMGHTGGGWLLSPDFRNNSRAIELRYAWKIDNKQKLEARIRNRKEIDQLTTELRKRDDDDLYIRYTLKF